MMFAKVIVLEYEPINVTRVAGASGGATIVSAIWLQDVGTARGPVKVVPPCKQMVA